jgi:hypothetical protein
MARKQATACNKPRRIRKGEAGYGKKKKVVTACQRGKKKTIRYGDAKMRIKKSNPKRRKSFRARHGCDKKTTRANKLTAKYWSCKEW